MASPKEHFDAARRWQEHYQKEVEDIGLNIPSPTLGQTTNDYRREMMRLLKKTFIPTTHDLYRVQMRQLPDDVLAGFEQMLLPACKTEAYNPLTVPNPHHPPRHGALSMMRSLVVRAQSRQIVIHEWQRPSLAVAAYPDPTNRYFTKM